jgi:hypothetical protein
MEGWIRAILEGAPFDPFRVGFAVIVELALFRVGGYFLTWFLDVSHWRQSRHR